MTGNGARIGWIPSARDTAIASTRLRCALPCRYLREAGWSSELLDRRDPGGYDLVVFQKIYDEDAIQLARSLRDRGVVTVFDLCDNHFFNPEMVPLLTERVARLERMLESVDAISVSSEPLRELLTDRDATVIDDALDELNFGEERGIAERFRGRLRAKERGLRVAWFGNAGLESPPFGLVHLRKIMPVLEDFSRSSSLRLTVISNSREKYEKAIAGARIRSRYIEWQFRSFPSHFREHDICVIPIELNPFTVCKTGNRVALSLQLGVPVIADPIPSFQEFSDFILLGDWPASLERYASEPALRERHASEGRRYVEAKYTKARVIAQWSEFFEQLLATAGRTQRRTPEASKAQ